MNWDALGAGGELVGALAVVLTLGFLAKQIRSANDLRRAEGRDLTVAQFNDWRVTLAREPELASLWLRGARGDALEEADAFRFEQLVAAYFLLFLTWASRAQENEAPEVQALACATLCDELARDDRGELRRRWLARDFSGDFTVAVNAELERRRAAAAADA